MLLYCLVVCSLFINSSFPFVRIQSNGPMRSRPTRPLRRLSTSRRSSRRRRLRSSSSRRRKSSSLRMLLFLRRLPPPPPPRRSLLSMSLRPPRLLLRRRIARRRSPRSSLRPARRPRPLLPSPAPGSRRLLVALLLSVSVPLLLQAVLSLLVLVLSSLVLTTFLPVFTTSHLELALLPLVPSRRSMESGSALSRSSPPARLTL